MHARLWRRWNCFPPATAMALQAAWDSHPPPPSGISPAPLPLGNSSRRSASSDGAIHYAHAVAVVPGGGTRFVDDTARTVFHAHRDFGAGGRFHSLLDFIAGKSSAHH